jgi:hypothetical protein
MDISPTEARDALRDVEQTSARSGQSQGYRYAAPHLFLWGVIWMIGYAAPVVFPGLKEGWCWLVLDLFGMAGSSLVVMRAQHSAEKPNRNLRGLWGVTSIVTLFLIATFAVMHPTESAQYHVFPALVLGLVYGLLGLYLLPKFLWIAGGISGLSLLAFFILQPYLPLCIAAVGGGGLVIGGIWMRRL